jgi:hypothetical protein
MQSTTPVMTILNTNQGTAQFPSVPSKSLAHRAAQGTSPVGNHVDAVA